MSCLWNARTFFIWEYASWPDSWVKWRNCSGFWKWSSRIRAQWLKKNFLVQVQHYRLETNSKLKHLKTRSISTSLRFRFGESPRWNVFFFAKPFDDSVAQDKILFRTGWFNAKKCSTNSLHRMVIATNLGLDLWTHVIRIPMSYTSNIITNLRYIISRLLLPLNRIINHQRFYLFNLAKFSRVF